MKNPCAIEFSHGNNGNFLGFMCLHCSGLFGSQEEMFNHYCMVMENTKKMVQWNSNLHQPFLQSSIDEEMNMNMNMNMNLVVPYPGMDFGPSHHLIHLTPIPDHHHHLIHLTPSLDDFHGGDDGYHHHDLYDLQDMMMVPEITTYPPSPLPSPELYNPQMTLDLISIMDNPIALVPSPPPFAMALEVARAGLALAPPVFAPAAVSIKREEEELFDEVDLELKL